MNDVMLLCVLHLAPLLYCGHALRKERQWILQRRMLNARWPVTFGRANLCVVPDVRNTPGSCNFTCCVECFHPPRVIFLVLLSLLLQWEVALTSDSPSFCVAGVVMCDVAYYSPQRSLYHGDVMRYHVLVRNIMRMFHVVHSIVQS